MSEPGAPPPKRGIRRGLMRALRVAGKPVEWLLIAMVRAYQWTISPLLPNTCRFTPSCSRYMIEALQKKGPVIGLLKGVWRVMRCNPLCRGGYDPVEKPQAQQAHRDDESRA